MVLERLKEYINYKGISVAAFEKAVGMSNSSFRKVLASGKGIGTDKLENILSVYTDLSAEWLLRGAGHMLTDAPVVPLESGRVMSIDKAVDILHNNQTVIIGNWEELKDVIESVLSREKV